jgi:hypothetical protein
MVMRFMVPPAMRVGFKSAGKKSFAEIGQGMKEDLGKTGEFMKENFNPKDPFFKKDTREGRSINNLWTGYKLGGPANLMVAGSVLGGGAIIASNPRNIQNAYDVNNSTKAESEMNDIESLQSTRGDGQGYQASIGAKALANLSTSGDLVFAMHKTRHSGQL